jgi:putative transposase
MTDYRRNRVPGNLADPRSDLLTREINILRDAVRNVRARNPFHIDAWVILPEHMHCIWTLPDNDINFSMRWQAIKTAFSKRMTSGEHRSASRAEKDERGIWQRRFWEHTIRDDRDYAAHLDYIHFNPVKHGLVTHAAAWQYSSFHRCVTNGLYPPAWNSGATDITAAGERTAPAPGAKGGR